MNAPSFEEERDGFTRHIRNLTQILALPSLWCGRPADSALESLCDVLLRMFRLTFVCGQMEASGDFAAIEVFRADSSRAPLLRPHHLRSELLAVSEKERSPAVFTAINPLDDSKLVVATLHLGFHNRLGALTAAAARSDFPTELELLTLQVAATTLSLAFEETVHSTIEQRAAAQLEVRLAGRMRQLLDANAELRDLLDDLAAELGAMSALHEFSTRLSLANGLSAALDETLTAIMCLQGAEFGHVQLNDPERGGLVMVAQRNFQPSFLERYALVRPEDSSYGRAFTSRARVIIEDVASDASFAPHRQVAAAAGFSAMQSTPLIGHLGELLGVLSTHFDRPHRPSDFDLRLTDLYARYAIQMIERNRAEEERSKLASIVENSGDFIGIASLAGRALFLNPAGRRMIGLRDDEPILDNIRSYLVPEDRERLTDEIMLAVERLGFWDGETALRHTRSGAKIPVLQHVFFIRESQTGRRLGLATVCRDITERRRAEQAASNTQQELARASRVLSLGELTTSIAHEINQPLAAIVANGDACLRWIQREVPDLEEARCSLDRMIRDANRASDVIRRIQAFATKAILSRSPVNVNEVVREVLALTHNEVLREQVVLRTCLTHNLTPVQADRIELQQVVLNLVINAIEAMRSVTNRQRLLSIFSIQRDACSVEVSVRDSGNGVEPQHFARLFEPFYTTKPHGMGLGLSISRRIIEAHGGQLMASRNATCGLTLCFRLPAKAGRAQ